MNEDDLRAASINAGPVTVEWIPIMQRWRWHAIAVNEEGHSPSLDLAILQAFEKVSEIHEFLFKATGYPAHKPSADARWEIIEPEEVKVYDENGDEYNQGGGAGVLPDPGL